MKESGINATRKTAADDNIVKVLFRGHDGGRERVITVYKDV